MGDLLIHKNTLLTIHRCWFRRFFRNDRVVYTNIIYKLRLLYKTTGVENKWNRIIIVNYKNIYF